MGRLAHPGELPDRSATTAHDPDGDVYAEACGVLHRAAADHGVRIVLTGFGGDEMMSHFERNAAAAPQPDPPDWLGEHARQLLADVDRDTAPAAPISLATLRTLTAHNPPYLRHGLWPVAPLADPRLYELGRSLPLEWRTGKTLLRRRLDRAGLGVVAARGQQESFEPIMDRALQARRCPAEQEMTRGLAHAGFDVLNLGRPEDPLTVVADAATDRPVAHRPARSPR